MGTTSGIDALTRPLTESDKAAFRDRMCDVAQARFSQHGLQAVTMRDLAAGMGVSSMTPYRYFKDKNFWLQFAHAPSRGWRMRWMRPRQS